MDQFGWSYGHNLVRGIQTMQTARLLKDLLSIYLSLLLPSLSLPSTYNVCNNLNLWSTCTCTYIIKAYSLITTTCEYMYVHVVVYSSFTASSLSLYIMSHDNHVILWIDHVICTSKHLSPRGSSSSLSNDPHQPATCPTIVSISSSASVVMVTILSTLELRREFFLGRPKGW